MEQVVELNHSLLSKLPLEVQNLFKSLPLSDFSILLISGLLVLALVYLLSSISSSRPGPALEDFGEYKREAKVVQVKVNTPNPKKNLRRGKKKKNQTTDEPVEEKKQDLPEETFQEDGWEPVKAKKPKRKAE